MYGGIFPGGLMYGWYISGGIFLGGIFPGGNFPGGLFPDIVCPCYPFYLRFDVNIFLSFWFLIIITISF